MFGTIADTGLVASIVVAPVAGGSVHPVMLPILAVLAAVSFAATLLGHARAGRRQHIALLPLGLLVASACTLLQAIPIPTALLSILSPRAHELRDHVGALTAFAPISYEPSATLRLAALLALYAMIAHVAYERASIRRGFTFVSRAVLAGAMASLALAVIHRFTGAEKMLGLLESARPPSRLLTTFVNPNHGAGFMLLASLIAIGLAVAQRTRRQRARYLVAAILTACASALCLSRGGLIALGIGFVLFVVMLMRKGEVFEDRRSSMPALIGAVVAVPLAGLVWSYTDLLREFTGTEEDPLGFAGKLAAMRDAGPLIAEHPIFGIGRGAYASVYPAYKTAPHQLTYTHPENVVVQMLADWGVLLGSIALIALVWTIYRRIKFARNVAVLGAMVGVAALALQNLVDFSLEVPGVAIPVAAILGAAGIGAVNEHRFELSNKRGVAFAAVPFMLLAVSTIWTMSTPDLNDDLKALAEASWSKDPTTLERVEQIAHRHPANAIAAARAAYAAETADPPQLKTALRWANRTMLLAPTYADGHLVTGRLLLRFGHRAQGFTEMRNAWELVDAEHRDAVITHIVQLARSPEEVVEALPRRDEVMDEPDEREIAKAMVVLASIGKETWAKALLAHVGRIESVRSTDLIRLASAALMVGEIEFAERALERRRAVAPGDDRAVLMLLELLRKKDDVDGIAALIREVEARPDIDPIPFLHARLDLALRAHQVDVAREVLGEMRRRLPPTEKNQVFLARMRSRIESEDSHPIAALRAMDDAIRLSPGSADLRVERANLLIRMGKHARARLDLVAALRIDPKHRRAEAMLANLPPESP